MLAEHLRDTTHVARIHPKLVEKAHLDDKAFQRENDLGDWADALDKIAGCLNGHPGCRDKVNSDGQKLCPKFQVNACDNDRCPMVHTKGKNHHSDVFKAVEPILMGAAKEGLSRKAVTFEEAMASFPIFQHFASADEKRTGHTVHAPPMVQPDMKDEHIRGLCFQLKKGLPETLPKQTMPLGGNYGHTLGADLSELAPLHRNDMLSTDRTGVATDLSELPEFLRGMTKHSLAGLIWPRLIRELNHHGVRAEISTQNTGGISTAVRNSADGASSLLMLSWEEKPTFLGPMPAHLAGDHAKAWEEWALERADKWKQRKVLGARLQHCVTHFYNSRRKRQEADLKAWQTKKGKLLDTVLERSAEFCADNARLGKDECTVNLEDLMDDDSLLASLRHTILRANTYSVIKDCDLTMDLSVNSKSIRKLKGKWVVDLLEDETIDPVGGARRIKIKVRYDGSIGWATLMGEYGTVFMVPHTYVVVKEASLTNSFANVNDQNQIVDHHTIRKLKPGEVIEVLELQKRDPVNNVSRIHCKTKSDNTIGWVTVATNTNVCERVCPSDLTDQILRGFILAQTDKHCAASHPLTELTGPPHRGWEGICGTCGKEVPDDVKLWTCQKCKYYECNVCYVDPIHVALQDPGKRVKLPEVVVLGNNILPDLIEIWKEERVLADILYRPPPAMCQVKLRWGKIAVERLKHLDYEEESEA